MPRIGDVRTKTLVFFWNEKLDDEQWWLDHLEVSRRAEEANRNLRESKALVAKKLAALSGCQETTGLDFVREKSGVRLQIKSHTKANAPPSSPKVVSLTPRPRKPNKLDESFARALRAKKRVTR